MYPLGDSPEFKLLKGADKDARLISVCDRSTQFLFFAGRIAYTFSSDCTAIKSTIFDVVSDSEFNDPQR